MIAEGLFRGGKKTYHPAPSVPRIEPVVLLDHLNDVELVIVVPDVCLIEHAVVVFVHLARQRLTYLTNRRNPRGRRGHPLLTSADPDSEQCSSTFLLPVTWGPAARRASLVDVKASLGFGFSSSFAFFPPALAAEAALLFGGMIPLGKMQADKCK